MSLMTHADAVPWGESIRPRCSPDTCHRARSTKRLADSANASGLSPREMNVLLTWVTGGTPIGERRQDPKPSARDTAGRSGLRISRCRCRPSTCRRRCTRAHDRIHRRRRDRPRRRGVRAVDLLPGNAGVVRAATIAVRSPATSGPDAASSNACLRSGCLVRTRSRSMRDWASSCRRQRSWSCGCSIERRGNTSARKCATAAPSACISRRRQPAGVQAMHLAPDFTAVGASRPLRVPPHADR